MALFGRIWVRNRVRVIDVEFAEKSKDTRYELRRYPDESAWVLVQIIRSEKLVNVLGQGYRYKTVLSEKELGEGTLAEMKRLAGTLTPQEQSA